MGFGVKVGAIEFAGDEIRVAVIKAGGKLPKVLDLVSRRAQYEEPEKRFEAMVAALDDALNALSVQPALYVLCESSANSIVRTLAIPFRGRRRVAAAVPFELEPFLAFPLEELLLDYNIVTEVEGETEVLAMGMRRGQVEERLAILEAAGVEAESITLDAVALSGLWQAFQKKSKGLSATLHVRASTSSIVVLFNGKLAYFRHLSCTAEQIREAAPSAAREIQNSLRAFMAKWRGGGEISQLYVTGIDFTLEQRESLTHALHLPLEDTVLISQLKGGALALDEGPLGAKYNTWEAVIGAAYGAAGRTYAINFQHAEQNTEGALRRVIPHLMFSSCLLLMILAGWGFYYYQGTARNEAEALRLQQQLDSLSEEIKTLTGKGLGADVNTDMFSDPTLIGLLADIAERMPEGKNVVLTDLRIAAPEAESWWIKLSGTVPDAAVFNEFLSKLTESALYRVDEEADLSVQGDLTTFTLKAHRPTVEVAENTHADKS